ncbi:MAG TPA: hypothetical protein VIY52_35090 [Streptosporangiaceae bacterium]
MDRRGDRDARAQVGCGFGVAGPGLEGNHAGPGALVCGYALLPETAAATAAAVIAGALAGV